MSDTPRRRDEHVAAAVPLPGTASRSSAESTLTHAFTPVPGGPLDPMTIPKCVPMPPAMPRTGTVDNGVIDYHAIAVRPPNCAPPPRAGWCWPRWPV